MLLTLLILHLTALTFANPFHKYPYAFLLDDGNEELEKVKTEQIKISKQGGSLALRYPAIGAGEDIAHVRVSGIDFGTDLKANIVDGGPGYKYVVLVLMGNPGVAYDAVITIQTLPSDNDGVSLQNIDSSSNTGYQMSEENDPNDSAEDLNDSVESEEASQISVSKENPQITQESSNVYNYAVNEALSGYGSQIHPNVNEDYDNEDNHEQNDINVPEKNQIETDETNAELNGYNNEDDSSNLIENQSQETNDNDYSSAIDDQNEDDVRNEQVYSNLYEEYQEFKQNLHNEGETYSRKYKPDGSGTIYIEEPGDNQGAVDLEQIFDDDYDNEDSRQYSDTNNNNFIDRSDGAAISY